MRPSKLCLIGWALLAVLLTYGVVRALGTNEKLEELRRENAVLTATNNEQAQLVTYAEERVREADAALLVADSAADARVLDADRELVSQAAHFRGLLADRPDLAIAFDSVEAAHAAKLEAVEDRAARKDVLRLAQIASRDSLIVRQRDQIQTQSEIIENLEDQVDRLDPPFFVGLFRGLPKLAATAGGAYVGSLVGDETGAALGASIGSLAF